MYEGKEVAYTIFVCVRSRLKTSSSYLFINFHLGLVKSGSLVPAPEPEVPKIPMVSSCHSWLLAIPPQFLRLIDHCEQLHILL